MTEEIKEILSIVSEGQDSIQRQQLVNYITNLQKENEKYKKMFEAKERFSKIMPDDTDFIILSKADYDRQQEDIELTAIKLKSRNEKAVEYINNLRDESAERQGFYNCFPDDLYIADIEELLNILEGGDE